MGYIYIYTHISRPFIADMLVLRPVPLKMLGLYRHPPTLQTPLYPCTKAVAHQKPYLEWGLDILSE